MFLIVVGSIGAALTVLVLYIDICISQANRYIHVYLCSSLHQLEFIEYFNFFPLLFIRSYIPGVHAPISLSAHMRNYFARVHSTKSCNILLYYNYLKIRSLYKLHIFLFYFSKSSSLPFLQCISIESVWRCRFSLYCVYTRCSSSYYYSIIFYHLLLLSKVYCVYKTIIEGGCGCCTRNFSVSTPATVYRFTLPLSSTSAIKTRLQSSHNFWLLSLHIFTLN